MDQGKRQIILAEIEQWRRSRLLPETYCDFLRNLYLEEHTGHPVKPASRAKQSIINSRFRIWMTFIAIIGILMVIAIHFTSFSPGVQIAIVSLMVIGGYAIGLKQRDRYPLIAHICMGTGSILLLLGGLYVLGSEVEGSWKAALFISICSIIWMVAGIASRLPALHLAGWIVLFLIYAWFLRQNIHTYDWLVLQLSWIPVSLATIWIGILLKKANRQAGIVWMLAGLIAWLGAEVYGLTVTEVAAGLLQVSLAAKLLVAGIVLYATRKTWTEWVG